MFSEFVQLWDLSSDGKSIPISHTTLVTKLGIINPDRPGQETLNILCAEGITFANIRGEYELTPKGLKIRLLYPYTAVQPQTEKHAAEEWSRFKKLLSYYIDCIHMSERSQQLLFPNKLNQEFFIPILPPNWLTTLQEGWQNKAIQIPIKDTTQFAKLKLEQHSDEDEEIYIGYPIHVISLNTNGKQSLAYSPVCLIPIDIVDSSQTSITIKMRLDEAEINQNWIEYSVPLEHRQSLIRGLYPKTNDEYSGLLDLKRILPVIEVVTNTPKQHINSESLERVLPRDHKEIEHGRLLFNAPVLFVGNQLRYSKTLKKELIYIRDNVDSKTLDSTALAYVFREHPLPNTNKDAEEVVPLPFIDCNNEQREAVYNALNKPASKVTGPPGTGKTQVAVNILANHIYNNQSVLFTSMNHKAVHAIRERSLSILKDKGLNLINFCSNEDNSVQNPWFIQDLDLLLHNAQMVTSSTNSAAVDYISNATTNWVRVSKHYSHRAEVCDNLGKISEKLTSLYHKLQYQLQCDAISISEYNSTAIKKHSLNLTDPKKFSYRPRDLLAFLHWKLRRKKKSDKAQEYLKTHLPTFRCSLSLSDQKEDLLQFCATLEEYQKVEKELSKIEKRKAELPELAGGIEILKHALDGISKYLVDALAIRMSSKIKELNNTNKKRDLQGIMTMLRSAKSPYFFTRLGEGNYAAAQAGFIEFSKYSPGWATTLLSLTKASPCMPGLFDKLIINEASQIEIAPMIPALFRAKTVTIVGDPNQFPPVTSLKETRHNYLKSKHNITELRDQAFDFIAHSAYDMLNVEPTMLKEHFRCASEIADYFNETYYANQLRVRTDSSRLNFPKALGYKSAIEWIDVSNSLEEERRQVVEQIKRLIEIGYDGSIGIITPFKKEAEELSSLIYPYQSQLKNPEITIATVNAFQGGERDLIIFMLGYNKDISKGQRWYVESPENRYIYNVATSRARACLLIVGDKSACLASGVNALTMLAQYPKEQHIYTKDNYKFESVVEEKLFKALQSAGIHTSPQYPILGRRLDFAIVDKKIDIEVDGKRWHLNSEGSRKLDDHFRDLQLTSAGWKVIRFWAFEINNHIEECVNKVKEILK